MQPVTILAIVGASHCILLAVVSFLQSSTPRASDKILTAILVIEGLRMFSLAGVAEGLPPGLWLYVHFLRLVIGPLVLFYTAYMIGSPIYTGGRFFLHFLPLALAILVMTLKTVGIYDISRQDLAVATAIVESSMFIVYGYIAQQRIRAYNRSLLQSHSSLEGINLGWLRYVCMYLTLMGVILLSGVIYLSFNPQAYSQEGSILVSTLTTLVFCYMISLKGIQQSRYFERMLVESAVSQKSPGTPVRPAPEPEAADDEEKYVSSSLSREDADHYYTLLLDVMEKEKLYLRHKLKLADLATETGLHPQQLSQVINQCANKHFYDFINGYRIEEVLRLLQEGDSQDQVILDIAEHAGFNSPATFYKYFRKYTGKSPRRYQQEAAA